MSYRNTPEDFWNRVDIKNPDECWEWDRPPEKNGYCYFAFEGKEYLVHRFSWMQSNGDIPKGLCVCHSCDNPTCCNPAHLWLGTRADNNVDRAEKGRSGARPNSKLTSRKADTIRAFHAAGIFTGGELARIHGISRQTVNRIVRNLAWNI